MRRIFAAANPHRELAELRSNLPRYRATRSGAALTGALFSTAVLSGCGPSPAAATAADRTCALPEGAPPATLPAPGSRLGFRIEVSESHLQRELERQVPRVLASAKNQSMGAAGRVSYSITRDDFTFATPPGALQITTQLTGDIDTCKPVGPFCIAYGSCEPRWSVELRIPTDFERAFGLQPSTQIEVTRGCMLRPVGYDATPELERITRQEARGVRQRLRSELARAERRIQEAWERWQQPTRLPNGDCWRLSVETVSYAPPRLDAGMLHAAIEATGNANFGCTPEPNESENESDGDSEPNRIGVTRRIDPESTAGPRIVAKPDLAPELAWNVPFDWPLDAIERALGAHTGRPISLRVVGTSAPETPNAKDASSTSNTLFLSFDANAACPNWQRVTPRLDETQLLLGLSQGDEAHPETLALPLPNRVNDVKRGIEHLQTELREALTLTRDQGLELELELELDVTHGIRPEIDREGLRLVVFLEGTARATLGDELGRPKQP